MVQILVNFQLTDENNQMNENTDNKIHFALCQMKGQWWTCVNILCAFNLSLNAYCVPERCDIWCGPPLMLDAIFYIRELFLLIDAALLTILSGYTIQHLSVPAPINPLTLFKDTTRQILLNICIKGCTLNESISNSAGLALANGLSEV